jgi:hypothetical protein
MSKLFLSTAGDKTHAEMARGAATEPRITTRERDMALDLFQASEGGRSSETLRLWCLLAALGFEKVGKGLMLCDTR